jgi:hypothetical protein
LACAAKSCQTGGMILRVLIPSWRFFDEAGTVPTLWYRLTSDGNTWGDWLPCPGPTPKRSWMQLILNPTQSYRLACHSLVARFADDLESGSDSAVSRELIENLVASQAPRETSEFQFKLLHADDEIYASATKSLNR